MIWQITLAAGHSKKHMKLKVPLLTEKFYGLKIRQQQNGMWNTV